MTAAPDMSQVSRAFRLQQMGLTVDGQTFDLRRYPYLIELFDRRARRRTVLKGAQMGFTSTFVLDAIESARENPSLRGIGYFFPTESDVFDFSQARFGPMMDQAAFAGLADSIDRAGLKIINTVPVYFRAAGAIGASTKQSLARAKSIAIDRLYKDESDEMQAARVDAINHRLDGSQDPENTDLSTPTIPGFGVDYAYRSGSSESVWHWECTHCSKLTSLELTWPNCIAEPIDGEPYYLCGHCGERLERHIGEWVAKHPDNHEHLGYWVSQLSSPTKSAADVLKAHEDAEQRGRMREFFNQVLARPFAEVEDQLTKQALDDCLTDIPRQRTSPGPTCAGADPGVRGIHWIVKQRTGDRDSQILNYGECSGFEDLHQIERKFNVSTGIIDQMAEVHSVRAFVDEHRAWWGGRYVSERKGTADWDPKAKTVTMARNEALDASHAKFIEKKEKLPLPDEMYHEKLVPQMCNMARIRNEDPVTGDIRYRWVVLGGVKNDHLKHCHGYATVAEERTALAGNVQRARHSSYSSAMPRVGVF